MPKGKLIVIEGTDGSGKTTQLELLLKYLKDRKVSFTSFDFPQYGKTFFGDFVGRFLNGEFGHFTRINPYLAMFPYAADRWQVKGDLWNAVNTKKVVLCNRYSPSVLYQAVKVKPRKRAEFLKWAEVLEHKIFGIPKPNLVLFLYVPFNFAQKLIEKKNKRGYLNGKSKDQHEEDVQFLKKVEAMYLKMVKSQPDWIRIDCVKNNRLLSPEEVHGEIIKILKQKRFV